MSRVARLVLLTSSFASAVEYYDGYIDKVYAKCDNDKDLKLSTAEMTDFLSKVDVDAEMTAASLTPAGIVSQADAGSDGVSKAELIAWVVNSQSSSAPGLKALGDAIIQGMTGINTDLGATTSGIGVENTKVTEAKAFVELVFKMEMNPEDLFTGERKGLRQTIINLLNIPSVSLPADIFMTISAGSSVVEAKAFTPTAAEASTGKSNLATALGPDKDTASSALGVTVSEKPTLTEGSPYPTASSDFTVPIVVAVIAILLGVLACIFGKKVANKQRMDRDADYAGCCSTGCCSPYALKGWSTGSVVAVIFLLSGAFLMFVAMGNVKKDIVCIIDKLQGLKGLGGDVGESMKSIESTLDLMTTIKPYVELLDVFAIVPAVLVSITMFISAGCSAREIRTMKWMKCFAFLSLLLLILCVVFYSIFSAIGILITYDDVQKQFIKVTSLCETSSPTIKQTMTDATQAVANAETLNGVSDTQMEDLKAKLDNAKPAAEIFEGVCDCINNLFFSINKLFIPGLVCVFASLYSIYAVFGLCCAGNCCCAPKKKMLVLKKVVPV